MITRLQMHTVAQLSLVNIINVLQDYNYTVEPLYKGSTHWDLEVSRGVLYTEYPISKVPLQMGYYVTPLF